MKDLFGHNFWNSVFPFWFQKKSLQRNIHCKNDISLYSSDHKYCSLPTPFTIQRPYSSKLITKITLLDITKGCLIWIKLDEVIKPWKYTIILVNTILIIKNIIISHTHNLVITFQKAFKNKNDDRILNYYRTSLWV